MKHITTRSGIKGWQDRLRNVYESFEEFVAYDEAYGIAERIGFKSCTSAWKRNPTIQGSTSPSDLRRIKSRNAKETK